MNSSSIVTDQFQTDPYCQARIENGAYKENENSLASVVLGYRDFIPYPVQPLVAWNYLFCGVYLLAGFAGARFRVAHYRSILVHKLGHYRNFRPSMKHLSQTLL
jgi:hypothetical protein